jgi:CDP-glycerol glycerophosphotransferase (TagB/SpsB family)
LHLNLWHGVALKNLQFAITAGPGANLYRHLTRNWIASIDNLAWLRRPEILAVTSQSQAEHFARCFDMPIERCAQIGTPRLDVANDEELRKQALDLGDYGPIQDDFSKFGEVYVYMPTFRDTGRDFLSQAFPDFEKLNQVLAARGALLFLKLHPFTTIDTLDLSASDRIRMWPAGLDIYPFLDRFTLLITDYSSVLYDYIFLKDRGVLLYTFDYDDYVGNDRDFAMPFDQAVVGTRVDTFELLCNAIEQGEGLSPIDPAKLDALRAYFWGDCPPLASARVVSHVEDRLEAAAPQKARA